MREPENRRRSTSRSISTASGDRAEQFVMLALAGLIGFVGRPRPIHHWNPARRARAETLARDGKFVSKKTGIVLRHLARPSAEMKSLRLAVLNSPRGHSERTRE